MLSYLKEEASFAPISFEVQQNDNWTDNLHSIIQAIIWIAVVVGNWAKSNFTRLKWTSKDVDETPL